MFGQIWLLTDVLGQSRKSKMVDPGFSPFGNYGVISTSYNVITTRYGPQRKHPLIYLPSFIVIALILTVLGKKEEGDEDNATHTKREKK